MPDFRCVKCGAGMYSATSLRVHEKECKGAGISMAIIQGIKEGGNITKASVSFTCVICEGSQEISGIHNWGREVIFPVCDNCKRDLKDIILTKRNGNERVN